MTESGLMTPIHLGTKEIHQETLAVAPGLPCCSHSLDFQCLPDALYTKYLVPRVVLQGQTGTIKKDIKGFGPNMGTYHNLLPQHRPKRTGLINSL